MKNKEMITSINEFKKHLKLQKVNENNIESIVLTNEMEEILRDSSDIFGVGDFDETDEDRAFTQDDFNDVIDSSTTVGELINNLDNEFDLDSKEVVLDILNFL